MSSDTVDVDIKLVGRHWFNNPYLQIGETEGNSSVGKYMFL